MSRIQVCRGVTCPVNLLSRRTFLLGGGLALASYLGYEVNTVRLVRYTVPVRNLPPAFHGFTILHLSDLHQKEFGRNQARLLSRINRLQYDMVAITGDLVNQYRLDVGPALDLIAGLAPKPLFFVNGNNEWGAVSRHRYRIAEWLVSAGVAILNNRAVALPRGDGHLWIAGVDEPSSSKDRLAQVLSGATDGAPILLLAHYPTIFPRAAQAGVDLVLAGHTHGGQVRIPFVGALWAPGLGLVPRWDYGEFHEGKSTMIVNGGLGESIIPVRFAIPPEIALVTLAPLKGTAEE